MFTKTQYILVKSFFLAIGWSYLHDLLNTVLKILKLLKLLDNSHIDFAPFGGKSSLERFW